MTRPGLLAPHLALNPRRLVVLVVCLLALLFGATTAITSMHDRVRAGRVRDHLSRGQALAAEQDLAGAVQHYRAALSLDRENPAAARALAVALMALGRLSEAETYLRDLLRRDPIDGRLNRDLARIHFARGREMEARAAYQRAIYGEWPDALEGRMQTRFELIDYLTKLDARGEILAELLRLNAELPAGQTAGARRVADMLVREGATELAIDVLRNAAVAAARDTDLLAHLADVQGRAGRTTEARATLRRALTVEPGREDLRLQLAVVDRVLALDPTLPGLRLVTRTRRARLVLAAVVAHTRECQDGADAAEIREAADEAAKRLRAPARADAEAAEQELALAARLWSASPGCHGSSAEARALAQVIQHVEASAEQTS